MSQKQFKIKSIQPISVEELQPSPELMEVQNFLPISPEDRERLKRDIEKSGEIRDPIKIYFDNEGNPLILGGFNRWNIARELGWQFVPCEVMTVVQKERRELAIMDNLARRHMTREQKQKIVEMFLKNDPVQSDRTIAKKTGADHKTVGVVRNKLESTGEIPQLEKRAGADGKIRKAEPEKPVKKNTSTGEIPQLPDKKSSKSKITINVQRQPGESALGLLNSFKSVYEKEKKSSAEPYLRGLIAGIITFSESLCEAGHISKEELQAIKKFNIK